MHSFFPLILLVGTGALICTQMSINAAMGRSLGLPLFVAVFSLLQFLWTLPPLFIWGRPIPWAALGVTPHWQYAGAALGVPILAAAAYGFSKAGAFTGLVCVIVGQMLMGVVIDHFGLFGAPVHSVSLIRLAGVGFLILGVVLVKQ
ncbi:MAG: DMT family transporter [Bdellovibrionota bacterium]